MSCAWDDAWLVAREELEKTGADFTHDTVASAVALATHPVVP